MTYEFENKESLPFIECSDEEKLKIIKAIKEDRCEFMSINGAPFVEKTTESIFFKEVYRTLKPAITPN